MANQNGSELKGLLSRDFQIEKIDTDLYRSKDLHKPLGARSVFGGQVIAQALMSAIGTVPDGQVNHSLHCYFLRPGDISVPIVYHVDETRQGHTYCSRTVKATQQGKAIFSMEASFKRPEGDPYHHQFTMPSVPPPDALPNTRALLQQKLKNSTNMPERVRRWIKSRVKYQDVIERRPVDKEKFFRESPQPATQCVWVKAKGVIGNNANLHRCVAAYMSDMELVGVATLPAGDWTKPFFVTTLDHSVWFHTELQADQWLLYEMECHHCADGRAFITGRLWRQDGVLAMSVAQEGVIRSWQAKL